MFTLTVVLAALVGAIFVTLGIAKLLDRPMMAEGRRHLRIAKPLWRVIGLLEILGGAGVVVGLYRDLAVIGVLAAAGLVGITIGATFYHQRAGDRIRDWLPAVVVGSLVVFYAIARVGSA